jgi:hypothetical protein
VQHNPCADIHQLKFINLPGARENEAVRGVTITGFYPLMPRKFKSEKMERAKNQPASASPLCWRAEAG